MYVMHDGIIASCLQLRFQRGIGTCIRGTLVADMPQLKLRRHKIGYTSALSKSAHAGQSSRVLFLGKQHNCIAQVANHNLGEGGRKESAREGAGQGKGDG